MISSFFKFIVGIVAVSFIAGTAIGARHAQSPADAAHAVSVAHTATNGAKPRSVPKPVFIVAHEYCKGGDSADSYDTIKSALGAYTRQVRLGDNHHKRFNYASVTILRRNATGTHLLFTAGFHC